MDEDHFNQEAYCSSEEYHYSARNHCLEANLPQRKVSDEDRLIALFATAQGELDEFDHTHSAEDEGSKSPAYKSLAVQEDNRLLKTTINELQQTENPIEPDSSIGHCETTKPSNDQTCQDESDPKEIACPETATAQDDAEISELVEQSPATNEEKPGEPSTPLSRREQG